MVVKSKASPDEMSGTSRGLTTAYTQLIDSARGALATIESAEVHVLSIHMQLPEFLQLQFQSQTCSLIYVYMYMYMLVYMYRTCLSNIKAAAFSYTCTSCVTSQIAKRLQQTAHSLGDACVNLVYSSADVQMNPDDMAVKRELADQAKSVTEKVSEWMGEGGSECVCEGGREGGSVCVREGRRE